MNTDEPILGPFENSLDQVLPEYLDSNWQQATRERHKYWLFRLIRFLSKDWTEVTRADLIAFEQHLQWSVHHRGGLYSALSADQALRMIRQFYAWAHSTGRVASNPMKGWIFPRLQPQIRALLDRAQALKLLNLPDLATPAGQLDALLLHLVYYQGFGLEACRRLRCDGLAERELEPATQGALQRYVQDGRVRLKLRWPTETEALMLSPKNGQPYGTEAGLAYRLCLCARQMGLGRISARLLQHSYRAHQLALQRRLTQFNSAE